MSDWILVLGAIVGGLIVGMIASRIVHGIVGSSRRPEPIQRAAKPLSSLALAVGIVGGLIVALGIVQPDSLDQLIDETIPDAIEVSEPLELPTSVSEQALLAELLEKEGL